jgi:anaerobic selenocysteine-containing dehydrogenase
MLRKGRAHLVRHIESRDHVVNVLFQEFVPKVHVLGRDIDADYPFQVVTFRLPTRTKARTAYDYWALETHPINYIEVNRGDASRLGIRDGDCVRLVSPSGSAEGLVKISERVRPGVIAGTHHFGHTQQGNSAWQIANAADAITGGRFVSPVLHGLWQSVAEGHQVRPDPRRGSRGFSVNDAMRRNDALAGTPLVDNAGGATVFLDSRVRLEKLSPGLEATPIGRDTQGRGAVETTPGT